MYNISNRAIVIAVGLLVTIAITSSVVMVMGYFRDIYSDVKNTDISLRKMFNKYDPYDNTTLTGLDILNAVKRFRNDPTVNIIFKERGLNIELNVMNVSTYITKEKYAYKYSSTCIRKDDGATIVCE